MSEPSTTESSISGDNERREDGWEDVEPDEEPVSFRCLFDNTEFSNVLDMLHYCKDKFGFDVWLVKKSYNLDYLGQVKLINYVRAEVSAGNLKPTLSSESLFSDDKYLKPVLEDDAVLFSLDDVFDEEAQNPAAAELESLREQLAVLHSQFTAYREEVQKVLEQKDDQDDSAVQSESRPATSSIESKLTANNHAATGVGVNVYTGLTTARVRSEVEKSENDYFSSYSYSSIHEIMLKDSVRTDAYRDFIYDNKDLFKGKTVLDVGCGTGVLSMFCAKAGAKLVIAVDNSEIIDKARRIIYENGLQDQVKCLRGKVEEINLPVPKVDIIVSEWMGYCLLYESMLDSVIWARDHYLADGGLMVPSHARLLMAPLADSDLVASHIDFWKDVYGFDMTSMLDKAYDEALVRVVDTKDVAADGTIFLDLDLHKARVSDLSFDSPFSISWAAQREQSVDGFVIWFDMFFLRSCKEELEKDLTVEQAKQRGIVAFSTGPANPPTHWQQGVLIIKEPGQASVVDDGIAGRISFQKRTGQQRSINIDVEWGSPACRQGWFLD